MRDENGSWFDDPEWEKLRQEVNGRSLFGANGRFRLFGKRAEQVRQAAPQPPLPTMQPPRQAQPQPVQPVAPVHARPFRAPASGRPQQYVQPQNITASPVVQQPMQPDGAKKVNVSVNLTIPEIKLFKHPLVKKVRAFRLSRKQWVMTGAACLVLVSSFGALKAFNGRDKGVEVNTGVLGQSATPEYEPVLPHGQEDSTTSKKVLYDPEKKVASYTDTINGIPVTVSQQPMPEKFNEDPDGEVRKLAENFSANTEIKAGGLTGYLGTSAKGPQSMVLKKRSMLIFIFSEKTIPNEAWGQYIAALE